MLLENAYWREFGMGVCVCVWRGGGGGGGDGEGWGVISGSVVLYN